jgi:hypothetical protein
MHSKVKTPAAQQKIQQIAKDAPGALDTGAMANEPKRGSASADG